MALSTKELLAEIKRRQILVGEKSVIENLKAKGFGDNNHKPYEDEIKELQKQLIVASNNEAWELLTKYVCGRDMSGLDYYKDDIIKGLREMMSDSSSR